MPNTRKILIGLWSLYVVGLPVCSAYPAALPIVLGVIIFVAYPIWFVVWLVAYFYGLLTVGKRNFRSNMGTWWLLSVPYSVALPLLVLLLNVRIWAFSHFMVLFALFACLTILSSFLWTIAAIVQKYWRTVSERLMLGAVSIMVLIWVIAIKGKLHS
jgi:hypothetical protein